MKLHPSCGVGCDRHALPIRKAYAFKPSLDDRNHSSLIKLYATCSGSEFDLMRGLRRTYLMHVAPSDMHIYTLPDSFHGVARLVFICCVVWVL
jgi:hypothetical protein